MSPSFIVPVKEQLRRLAKTVLTTGLHGTGMDKVIGRRNGMQQLPLILGYHRVVEDFQDSATRSIAPMLVSTVTLEQHLDWVGKRYDFVSLDELSEIRKGTRVTTKPPAAVTFDDGYADVYTNAFPLLTRKGIPSAVFVVSDLVDSTKLQFHDELFLVVSTSLTYWGDDSTVRLQQIVDAMDLGKDVFVHLKSQIRTTTDPFAMMRLFFENLSKADNEMLIDKIKQQVPVSEQVLQEFHSFSWDMLKEMLTAGVTVGSHSKSHALLANESWATVLDEVTLSRQALERGLGVAVKHFAYPDGRFNAMSVKGVAEAGYSGAYTICAHQDSEHAHLTVPRKVLWEKSCTNSFGRFSPSIMSCLSNGVFDPALACDQNHGV